MVHLPLNLQCHRLHRQRSSIRMESPLRNVSSFHLLPHPQHFTNRLLAFYLRSQTTVGVSLQAQLYRAFATATIASKALLIMKMRLDRSCRDHVASIMEFLMDISPLYPVCIRRLLCTGFITSCDIDLTIRIFGFDGKSWGKSTRLWCGYLHDACIQNQSKKWAFPNHRAELIYNLRTEQWRDSHASSEKVIMARVLLWSGVVRVWSVCPKKLFPMTLGWNYIRGRQNLLWKLKKFDTRGNINIS